MATVDAQGMFIDVPLLYDRVYYILLYLRVSIFISAWALKLSVRQK